MGQTQYLPPKYFYDQNRREYQVHQEVIDEWGQRTIRVFHYPNSPPPPPHYFLPHNQRGSYAPYMPTNLPPPPGQPNPGMLQTNSAGIPINPGFQQPNSAGIQMNPGFQQPNSAGIQTPTAPLPETLDPNGNYPGLLSIRPKPEDQAASTPTVTVTATLPTVGPIPMYPAPPTYMIVSPVPLHHPPLRSSGTIPPPAAIGDRTVVHIPKSSPLPVTTLSKPEVLVSSVEIESAVIQRSEIETPPVIPTVVSIPLTPQYMESNKKSQEEVEKVLEKERQAEREKQRLIDKEKEREQYLNTKESSPQDNLYLGASQPVAPKPDINPLDNPYLSVSQPVAPKPKTKVKSFDAHDDL